MKNNLDTNRYPQYNFRFSGVKETFDKYTLGKNQKGELVAIDRKKGTLISDPLIIDRVKFSITWFNATEYCRSRDTTDSLIVTDKDYEYAFGENAGKTYAIIMANIQSQLKTNGDINPVDVVNDASQSKYKYSKSIAMGLFSEKKFADATNRWARRAIPDAKPQTIPVPTYDEAIGILNDNNLRI